MNVSRLLSVTAASVLGVGLVPGVAAAHSTPHGRFLPGPAHGGNAIRALGDDLPAVAAQNEKSPGQLKNLLTEDHTAWVGSQGQVFYVEKSAGTTVGTTASAAIAPSYPLTDTFALHSRPGSTRTIYLDFDGGNISKTWWNTDGLTAATYPGYDTDGNQSSFSDTEKTFVQQVFRQVAEIYAPFDVDVTTQAPAADALSRTSSTDPTFGTRVFVTDSTAAQNQVCHSQCLGMAYNNAFDHRADLEGDAGPAFVFTYQNNFSATVIAQSAAHEVGHTLGLNHDGLNGSDYYTQFTDWGPIMGASIDRTLSQFSMGEYTGATNHQDELAVMQTHGISVLPDDVVTTKSLGQQASYDVTGLISTRADTDTYSVDLPCATNLTVDADNIGAGASLDVRLDVGPSPALLTRATSRGLSESTTVAAPAGTYYLRVDGEGKGNPAILGDYSDYDSLGQYRLTATTSGCADGTTTLPTPPTTAPPTTPPAVTQTVAGAPKIGRAAAGKRRRPYTATAKWSRPASDGGAAITGYEIRAEKLGRHSRVSRVYSARGISPAATSAQLRLPRGKYRFSVLAVNAVGKSAWSARSNTVTAR